jgi:hypothetical protein
MEGIEYAVDVPANRRGNGIDWDAIKAEVRAAPGGQWAKVGLFAKSTASNINGDRLKAMPADQFEAVCRMATGVPGNEDGRRAWLWLRAK